MQCKYSCSTKQQVSYSPQYGIHFLNCCVHARSRRIYNKTRNNSKPEAIQLRDVHERIHFEQTWNAENSAWLSYWFWQAETNSIISVSRNSLLRQHDLNPDSYRRIMSASTCRLITSPTFATFQILGSFAKLRKKGLLASSRLCVCLSVRPSVHPGGITRLPLDGFYEILYIWVLFENLSRKFKSC